jgi:hypothetical protein
MLPITSWDAEGSRYVRAMTWRVMGLADTARHVIGCLSAQEARGVDMRVDDVVGNVPDRQFATSWDAV